MWDHLFAAIGDKESEPGIILDPQKCITDVCNNAATNTVAINHLNRMIKQKQNEFLIPHCPLRSGSTALSENAKTIVNNTILHDKISTTPHKIFHVYCFAHSVVNMVLTIIDSQIKEVCSYAKLLRVSVVESETLQTNITLANLKVPTIDKVTIRSIPLDIHT
jgi:hypothetical protein